MKKITLGLVLGICIAVGGSVFGVGLITSPSQDGKTNSVVITPGKPAIVGAPDSRSFVDEDPKPTTLSFPVNQPQDNEARFRSIEARLRALEAKQK